MGMDVYGKKPARETGKYFHNNVWWWRPLAEYCCLVAPELTAKCQHWQSNDGDGLNGRDSKMLALVLKEHVANGHAKAYEAIREAEQFAMADEKCWLCEGTGSRAPAPTAGAGNTGSCNGCDSTGRKRPNDCSYPFSVGNVVEFIAFLEASGGFKIC